MQPVVSVVIPLYNKEKHIQDTLKSVLAQTFEDFEVIVVNDGSTDNSLAEAEKIEDKRIKIFSIANQGVSHARNHGVEIANSEFIAFLDSDDVWKPNHLEDLNHLLQEFPNCGMYATAYELVFGKKHISSQYYKIPRQNEWNGIVADFFESSTINCIASSSSVMIPKKVFKNLGGFCTDYNSGEDIDMWIRIAVKYQIAFTTKVSVRINMSADNQVSQRSIDTRTHINLDVYDEETVNKSLKMYLDLNRFSIAIQNKLAGNKEEAKTLISKIDMSNLNAKQRVLLKMDTSALQKMQKLKGFLRKHGFGLSAFG